MSDDLLDEFISEENTQTTSEQSQNQASQESIKSIEETLEDEFTRLLKEFITESEQKEEERKAKYAPRPDTSKPVPTPQKNIDSFFNQSEVSSSVNLDAFIGKEDTANSGLDSFLMPEEPKTTGLDSFLTPEEPKATGLDSFLTPEEPKATGLDSFLTPEEPKATGLDGFITPQADSAHQKDGKGMFKGVPPVHTEKLSETQIKLKQEELELSRAITNFQDGIKAISKKKNLQAPETDYNENMLYPNYKPSVGKKIANHLLACWDILNKYDPENMQRLPKNANDEQFLVFAESLKDTDMQLVIISYVEILINLEICEVKYEQKKEIITKNRIKKELYEEYMRLQERKNLFIKKLKEQNFPIDVDKLMNNYFRAAQKDTKGAFNALTKNPAMFAPIQFEKIKPRFFGLIKVTPEDGIKMNQKIGEFIKKLKV